MTQHTCKGKPRPTCDGCIEDMENANAKSSSRRDTVVINAPNNRGTVIGHATNLNQDQ